MTEDSGCQCRGCRTGHDCTERSNVARQALDHFGEINQTDKAIEELGELIVALSRYRQADSAEKTERAIEVITELADSQIMIQQMRLLFGTWEVEQQVKFKIDRLIDRMGHG